MTRELIVLEEFDHGTLIQASSNPAYSPSGTDHVYYVPNKARRQAGLERIDQEDLDEEFRTENGSFDWEAIKTFVSPVEIVENAESKVLNRKDGSLGESKRQWQRLSFRHDSDRTIDSIPPGVVKFSDPEADDEGSVTRQPIERGYCWGVLQDRLLSEAHTKQLHYQDDVAQATTDRARVPMCVVKEGPAMITAYLVAHDHHENLISHFLNLETDQVLAHIEEFVEQR